MHELAFYFLPWAIIILPYYAVTAHLKSLWRFHYVFIAELATMAVSIVFLLIWHDSVIDLPLAYAAGYLCGLFGLLDCRGFVRVHERASAFEPDHAAWAINTSPTRWAASPGWSTATSSRS